MENLIDFLRDALFKTAPFTHHVVILPSSRIKEEVMLALLEKDVKVVTGVRFFDLSSAIDYLYKAAFKEAGDPSFFVPNEEILSLRLQTLIRDEQELSMYHLEEKCLSLANALAPIFLRYGKYGGRWLQKWKKEDGVQQRLWHKVFEVWEEPYEVLSRIQAKPNHINLHCFNLPFIPKSFKQVLDQFPCTHYELSPTPHYFEDLLSDQGHGYMQKLLKLKEASLQERCSLKEYSLGESRLLPNLGRLARLKEQEEGHGDYVEPVFSVQKELFHLEKTEGDASIEVHTAPCLLREVEVLYGCLLEHLSDNVLPSQIRVYAPDIAKYFPFIQAVFDDEKCPYRVKNLPLIQESQFLKGFFYLLDVIKGRFTFEDIAKLFTFPHLLKAFCLSEKEVSKVLAWLQNGGVSWGFDVEHRKKLASAEYNASPVGTWEHVIEHILLGTAMSTSIGDFYPFHEIDAADSLIFEKWMRCLYGAYYDGVFAQKSKLLAHEWATFFMAIIDGYFTVEEDERGEWEARNTLVLQLNKLHALDDTYSFEQIKAYLLGCMEKQKGAYRVGRLESVTFSSLIPGEIVPSSIVWILGMDEESFPRVQFDSSLDLMKNDADPCPKQHDIDRHLFLELLLSYRKKCIFSYVSIDAKDGKEMASSLLLDWTSHHIKERFNHPPFSFHKSYFTGELPGCLPESFALAKRLYNEKEALKPLALQVDKERVTEISLRQITKCLAHPIRYYLNEVLGIYPSRQKQMTQSVSKEFVLSPLDKAIALRRLVAEDELDDVLLRGNFPYGAFQHHFLDSLTKEKKEAFASLGISKCFVHTLSGKCGALEFDEHEVLLCSKGVVIFGKKSLGLALAHLPLVLALQVQKCDVEPNLLFVKDGKTVSAHFDDPAALLELFVEYFAYAKNAPSPLIPKWSDDLLLKDKEAFLKTVEMSLNPQNGFVDPNVQHLFASADGLSPPLLYETWHPLLLPLFEQVITWWRSL